MCFALLAEEPDDERSDGETIAEVTDPDARRSMALLKALSEAGYFGIAENLDKLRNNRDLDAVRPYATFQQITDSASQPRSDGLE